MERTVPQMRLRLVVNTQTPLVRLRQESLMRADQLHLEDLLPEVDYKLTAGGVTRMLQPLLSRGLSAGRLAGAEWIALAPDDAHPDIETPEGFRLSYVGIPADERVGYAYVKEHVWSLLNAMDPPGEEPDGRQLEAFRAHHERSAAALIHASKRLGGAHLHYVHDFQQLGVGGHLPEDGAARIFHLHTPFPSTLPSAWAERFVDALSDYDVVICSTHRYARNLRRVGLRTPIRVVTPFIDPAAYPQPSAEEVASFRMRFGIAPDDRVVLNIGRMDPMKGQDRLIRAMPELVAEIPNVRLVLVGNGSFSSSTKGGLGLSKGAEWRARLETLAAELDVADRVTFTGHLDDSLVPAALASCDAFALPSTREGFGLAAVEAWLYRKPVVVSDRAGVADLMTDGVNGLVVDCCEPARLKRALAHLLGDPEVATEIGEAGLARSTAASLPAGERALEAIFAELQAEAPHAV